MSVLPKRQVHLDFHTSECIDNIGSAFNKENFIRCLKKGHVNSMTVFAKCHHGWAYFPSETNTMHPGLHFDLLSEMLDACKQAGVVAPIYLSVGFDEKYAVEHPEDLVVWHKDDPAPRVLEKDGHKYLETAGFHLLCLNTPYLKTVEAQTVEVMQKFHPVGLFFDIVGPRICWCKRCNAEIASLGMDPNELDSHIKHSEIVYKRYYETVNNAARSVDPNVRLFHNGGHITCGRRDYAHANTHLELESLPTGGWGYDHFPKSARYAAKLDMEYLGMTGKFHLSWGEFGGFKHPNALRYEAALSLANGAGCSVGDQMHPYGFLDEATYELIGKAYAEVEAVEPYCESIRPIADIGLLSIESLDGKEARSIPADVGACRMLLEGHYLFDVLDTECDFDAYKLLILPDSVKITGALGEKLRAYVRNGGKVLCSAESGLDESGDFAFDFGLRMLGKNPHNPCYYHALYDALNLSPTSYVLYSDMYDVSLTDSASTVLGFSREPFFDRAPEHFCSHQHTPFKTEDHAPAVVLGKDGGYIAWTVFSEYARVGSIIQRDTVCRVLDALLNEAKSVSTDLPAQGVVALNKQEAKSRYVLHALYASPVKRGENVEIIEELVPLYNVSFEVRVPEAVKKVYLAPQKTALNYTEKDGVCCFTVPELTCSQLVVLEY